MTIQHISSHRLLSLLLALIFAVQISGCASNSPQAEVYGKRSLGNIAQDNSIRAAAESLISRENEQLAQSNINITVFNQVLLITGQVPDQANKNKVSALVKNINNVQRIHNELTVAENSTFGSRTNDGLLATKIRSRLLFTKGIQSGRIKTVIENGSLYLLGKATETEAKRIVDAMQKTKGLKRIVKVFAYITEGS